MSQHSGDFEDLLRNALHSAVDSAEPAGDGLERIRARLTRPHPLPVAWLMAVCSWVARYARGSLDSVSAWLQTVPGEVHRRDAGTAAEGWHMERLRLVATVATVAVLMAISVYAVSPPGQQVIGQAAESVMHSIGGASSAPREQGTGGRYSGPAGGSGTGPGTQQQGQPGTQQQGQPATSCVPGALSQPVPSPSPSPAGTNPASPVSPSPAPCASSPSSPSPSSPSPSSPSPSSPSPSSPSPSSPSPSSPSPSSPSPSSPSPSSPSPSSPPPSSPSPSDSGQASSSPPASSPAPSSPPASSPAPSSSPGPTASSAEPEDSASG